MIAVLGLLAPSIAIPQPYAFISAPGALPPAIHVVDLASMSLERTITGVGDEPSALALSPDRTRLYVSSWRLASVATQVGMVYVIDTRSREVIASQTIGERQSRAIALSPDGSVVYAWALSLATGPEERQLVRLHSANLAILDQTSLPQPDCRATLYNALGVHPDGRVFLLACESGVKWFQPLTAALGDVPGTLWGSNILGFSPTGSEIYLTDERTPASSAQSRLTSLEIPSGVEQRFAFAIPPGEVTPTTASRPRRLRFVQRAVDPPDQPSAVVLFGSGGPLAFAQIFGRATWSALTQSPSAATRQIVNSAVVGSGNVFPDSQFAATDDGTTLFVAGGNSRKFDSSTSAPIGSALALPGINSDLSDVVIVPFPPDELFANGFES